MRRALPPLLALVLALVLLTGCEFSLERLAHGGALPPPPEDYTGLQDGFRYTKTTLTGRWPAFRTRRRPSGTSTPTRR